MDLPCLTYRGVDNRHLQIVFEQSDNARRLPAAALDVDPISAGMLSRELLDVRVERLDGDLGDAVEGNVDRFHRYSFQPGLRHVVEHDLILHLGIAGADEFFDTHGTQTGNLHLWVGDYLSAIFL